MRGQRVSYSAAELSFVHEHHLMPRRDLAALFASRFHRSDVTSEHLKRLCIRNGWITPPRRRWTPGEDAVLRRLYADTPTLQIAEQLGRAVISTWRRAAHLGLRKDEAYLNSPAAGRLQSGDTRGITSRFQKGQEPRNKGKKMPPGVGGNHPNARRTQFKKGHLSGRAAEIVQPIGTERLSKDGYLERKINNDRPFQARWRTVQRIRWEEIHGPVPPHHALKCKSGDRLNTDPSNWELVPRGVLPRLNNQYGRDYDHAPDELKPTLMARAKLEHAVIERSRRGDEPTWKIQRRLQGGNRSVANA